MIKLDDLFQLQEDAAKWNLEHSSDLAKALRFIREFTGLVTESLESLGFGSDPAKQTVIRLLSVDSLSSLVIASRVALWGNVPESSVLIRTAVETLTIFECVVEENAFHAFDHEMRSKLRHFEYDECRMRLEAGSERGRLQGALSEVGGHTSHVRMKYSAYRLDGVFHDRLGAALDVEAAETATILIPDALRHLLSIIERAYKKESRVFPLAEQLDALNKRYRAEHGLPRHGGGGGGGELQ